MGALIWEDYRIIEMHVHPKNNQQRRSCKARVGKCLEKKILGGQALRLGHIKLAERGRGTYDTKTCRKLEEIINQTI